jgi:hypothetical protein
MLHPGTSAGDDPVPEAAFTREVAALDALQRRGFSASFTAEAGRLRVAGSPRRLRPEHVSIRDVYRFEGTSDPDDMSVVYALEARDGTRGVLVDAYGTYADPDVGSVLDRVPVERAAQPEARTSRRITWWPVVAGGAALGLGVLAAFGVALSRRARGRWPAWGPGSGRSPTAIPPRTSTGRAA